MRSLTTGNSETDRRRCHRKLPAAERQKQPELPWQSTERGYCYRKQAMQASSEPNLAVPELGGDIVRLEKVAMEPQQKAARRAQVVIWRQMT